MPILTTLVTAAGTSVAKILLKKYLSSAEIGNLLGQGGVQAAEVVSDELTAIAAAGLQDTMAQRQAVRIFEDLADRIIKELAPLLDEAGRHGHLNIEAVAQELGAALKGRISADLLLASDLDPGKLARAFHDAHPLPAKELSEAEFELYQRALSQTARYLVAVASQLPRFVDRLAVTQLQRIARMESEFTRALASVRMIEEQVSLLSPDKTYAQFEADYRQIVSQNVDELELFGVDIDARSRRYKLSVAYISLSFLEESSHEGEATLVSASQLLQQLRPGAGRLLIRGNAGSGKSTLFRWMALMVAQGGRKDSREPDRYRLLDEAAGVTGGHSRARGAETPWYMCVPFLIRLRDCKEGKLPPIQEFTRQMAWELEAPPGWMKSILEGGRALVLLDGVDEVPNRDRADIYNSVKRLIDKYPGCYYLLSTRPRAVERGWLKPLGFREADISPLSELDRNQLIDRWHEAVAHELGIAGQQGAELGTLAEELKRELRENLPIARLATNPLLAAMICALHRERSQRLPESQAELCEALCGMLLHRRERESKLELKDFPEAYRVLSYAQKRAIVAELAVHMARNEVSALDRTETTIKVGDVLHTIPGRDRQDAVTVLDGLIERSGMLREAQPGVVDFIHNTFKEYLAGDLLAQQRNDKFLADRVLDPAWQNIVLFAAAKGESTFVQNLLERVLGDVPLLNQLFGRRKKSKVMAEKRKRSVMAVRLGSVVQRLDKSLDARIDVLRSTLFPPTTMADAEALADSGDAVVPYLKYEPSREAHSAAACVRTLRLINSSAAKACLKDYLAKEERPSVLVELAQAVNPLEIKSVQVALLRGEGIPERVRAQVADVAPLAALTGLQRLSLSGTQVADVTPLAALTGLQTLFLSGTQVADVAPLAALTGLQRLDLSGTQVADVAPLAALTGLQRLSLSGTQVADVTPLAALTGLQRLFLSGTQVADVAPLAALTGLQTLDLSGTRIADVTPLAALTGLQMLDLSGTQVADVAPLAALTGLQMLGLNGTQVADEAPLYALKDLRIFGT